MSFLLSGRCARLAMLFALLLTMLPALGPRSVSAEGSSSGRHLPPGYHPTPVRATDMVPGKLVVRTRSGTDFHTKMAGRQLPGAIGIFGSGSTWHADPTRDDTFIVDVAGNADLQQLSSEVASRDGVLFAEPVYRYRVTGDVSVRRSSTDPLVGRQWAINKIDLPPAWEISVGAESVIIATVDTGVNAQHPDLVGRILPGYNAIDGTDQSTDDESHGTFGAGIMVAPGDNGVGIAGVCWRCRVLPVKALNSHGEGTSVDIADGVRWAANHGARVINLSVGGPGASQLLHEAVKYAVSKGIVVVAASGNEADQGNPVEYPAAFDEVFSVGATDRNDQRAFFSNYGPYLSVVAPGVDIVSTGSRKDLNGYDQASGTSFAAPYVSGLVGLLISINPHLTDRELQRIVGQTADDLGTPGPDDYYGFGRINAGRAAAAAKATTVNIPPPPTTGRSITFNETHHTLGGLFLQYWEGNGGLPVFGFPLDEQHVENGPSGTFWVQYFERNRFEYHPEKQAPYTVLLGRLGDDTLKQQKRDWFTFPKGTPGGTDCQYFEQTQHKVCGRILEYWRAHGLNDPKLNSYERSLQLWGLPLSEPMTETNSSGDTVLTQWFERARFEEQGAKGVLLGRLGAEIMDRPTNAAPPSPPVPVVENCTGIPEPIGATVQPTNCVKAGTVLSMTIFGFAPNEQASFWLNAPDGSVFGSSKTIAIGPDGRKSGLRASTTDLPPGLWSWVFAGTTSKHQSVVPFRILAP
ncbi:MAG: hypothetical protein NVS4B8_09620 [Herpetosiphon sp.]